MGIARHQHVAILVALLHQLVEEAVGKLHHVHQLVAGEELEVYQHLVVARAARVYLLAHVAELAGEHQLHLRVYVFHAVFDDKPALVGHVVDVLEFGGKRHELVVGE